MDSCCTVPAAFTRQVSWTACCSNLSSILIMLCNKYNVWLLGSVIQVSTALPKLQVLDDSKLGRPLSPVLKPAHTHRQLHAASTQPDALACTPLLVADALHDGNSHDAAIAMPGPVPPQHVRRDAASSRAARGHNRRQRPASASRLQQRLPPVAVGHNQPGSFLLYSLNQMPVDALLTAQPGVPSMLHLVAPRSDAISTWSEAVGHGQACSRDEVPLFVSLDGAESRRAARPTSAGIRRAESRTQSPSPSETSRCSPDLSSPDLPCPALSMALMQSCKEASSYL